VTGGRAALDRLLNEERIRLYGSGIVFGYAVAIAIRLVRHQWVAHPSGRPCTDFIWIWLSSTFASSPAPAAIYDHATFLAAKAAAFGTTDCILGHFDNPPNLLFFTWPLRFLPYPLAFAAWLAATLAIYLAAVYAILPRRAAVVAALTPFPVFFNILLGHNGFLTAGLLGLGLAASRDRPWRCGTMLGLLTYKPQFGILFPIALLARREWIALAAAAVASALFAAAAGAVFGWQTWPAFIDAVAGRAWSLSETPRQAFAAALVSIFGVLRSLGVGAPYAWGAQLAATASVALIVGTLWARPVPHSLQAAALAIGTLLGSPHAHGYDVCILTIGVAFLVEDGLARGFLASEPTVMLLGWLALFLLTGPVPAIVAAVLLILVLRRAVRLPVGAAAAADLPPAVPEPVS